jgi:hypothetical protein
MPRAVRRLRRNRRRGVYNPVMLCQFEERLTDGRWICSRCRKPTIISMQSPPKRRCGAFGAVVHAERCRFADVVNRLTVGGVSRLQLCRSSDCRLMLPVDGQIRCTGMPGRKCQWIGEWVARLNGEKEFSTGGNACPFWITSDPPVPPPAAPATNPPPLDIAAGH